MTKPTPPPPWDTPMPSRCGCGKDGKCADHRVAELPHRREGYTGEDGRSADQFWTVARCITYLRSCGKAIEGGVSVPFVAVQGAQLLASADQLERLAREVVERDKRISALEGAALAVLCQRTEQQVYGLDRQGARTEVNVEALAELARLCGEGSDVG